MQIPSVCVKEQGIAAAGRASLGQLYCVLPSFSCGVSFAHARRIDFTSVTWEAFNLRIRKLRSFLLQKRCEGS